MILCRYLVGGRSVLEKLVWLAIILTAFSLAGTLVLSNLQDVEENPIVTSIDTGPIKVIQMYCMVIVQEVPQWRDHSK